MDAADARLAAAPPPGLSLGAESEPDTGTVRRERRRVALAAGCAVAELQCTLGARLHELETAFNRVEVAQVNIAHELAESNRRAILMHALMEKLSQQVLAKREAGCEVHHIGDGVAPALAATDSLEPDAECSPLKPRPPPRFGQRRLRRAEDSGPLATVGAERLDIIVKEQEATHGKISELEAKFDAAQRDSTSYFADPVNLIVRGQCENRDRIKVLEDAQLQTSEHGAKIQDIAETQVWIIERAAEISMLGALSSATTATTTTTSSPQRAKKLAGKGRATAAASPRSAASPAPAPVAPPVAGSGRPSEDANLVAGSKAKLAAEEAELAELDRLQGIAQVAAATAQAELKEGRMALFLCVQRRRFFNGHEFLGIIQLFRAWKALPISSAAGRIGGTWSS